MLIKWGGEKMNWLKAVEIDNYFWIKRDWHFWVSITFIIIGAFLMGYGLK